MHAIARTLLFSALPAFSAHSALLAQAPGRITGRVIDAGQGTPIAGAVVELVGVTLSKTATSGIDGRYNLLGVPAGTVTIKVRLIGYTAKSVTGIALTAGAIVTQDVSLEPESIQLQELSVTAAAEKGSVASALSEQ